MGPANGVPVPSGGPPSEPVTAPTLGSDKHSWSNSRGYGYTVTSTLADKSLKQGIFAYRTNRIPPLQQPTDTQVNTNTAWSSNWN